MTHPHREWTRARLEQFIATTETLTLEFKDSGSLLPTPTKDRPTRILELSQDVSAMANEQGGTIIYGMKEKKSGQHTVAVGLDDGYGPADPVSREWLGQVLRDNIHPPLHDLDIADVSIVPDRHAFVVLVPQSRGQARQTSDGIFWRRDMQGKRKMTVQEIEDVRLRSVRPFLSLRVVVQGAQMNSNTGKRELALQLQIENPSAVTASFAVITVGVAGDADLTWQGPSEWHWVEVARGWSTARSVLASGSSARWSPITPGFTLPAEILTVRVPQGMPAHSACRPLDC